MRAWKLPAGSDGFDKLYVADLPDPEPGPGEVLIRVMACSINYRDFAVAAGKYFGGALKAPAVRGRHRMERALRRAARAGAGEPGAGARQRRGIDAGAADRPRRWLRGDRDLVIERQARADQGSRRRACRQLQGHARLGSVYR